MKLFYFSLLILLVVLVSDISASEKLRKHKKVRKHSKLYAQDLNTLEKDAKSEEDSKPSEGGADVESPPEVSSDEDNFNRIAMMDPCIKVQCGAGRVCQLDKEGEPQCVCIEECPVETEPRRKVCSNHNETWGSDCAIYQQRCYCNSGDPKCKGEQYRHIHIEYYGECREPRECKKEEMADFPRRMRDWLFNIMRDLAERDELSPHYLDMEKEAESNMTRRWTNAAIWKFCDLDGFPPDRSVSRHELFPIRAPLMALEQCIAPFLDSCDSDNDHKITIKEWAKCLELEEEDIDEKCEEILE